MAKRASFFLFGTDNTYYNGYLIDATARDFKRFIFGILGHQRDALVGSSAHYLFYQCALVGVNDIDLAPLKENISE